MKVLEVISLSYIAGGAEKNVFLTKEALSKRGHEVRVLSAATPDNPGFGDYFFEPVSKASPFKIFHHLFYIRSYLALRRAIRDFRPDLIHFHTMTALSPSVLFATGNIPSLLTIHGPEEFTLELLPWFMDPEDFEEQSFDPSRLTTRGRIKYFIYRYLQRPIYRLGLRRLRTVIAPSKFMVQATQADFAPVPLKLIYNGINLLKPTPLPAKTQAPTALYVGRMEPLKGPHYLIQAFAQVVAKLPTARLRLVGDGPQRPELEALAAKLDITTNVDFLGWVPQDHIADQYARANVVVVPSICPEALGLVAIEALSAGRPVVATQMGGLPELITPGHNGLTVPAADPAAMAGAIIQILSDPKLQQAMSAAAVASAQDFTVQHFIDATESLYREVVGR